MYLPFCNCQKTTEHYLEPFLFCNLDNLPSSDTILGDDHLNWSEKNKYSFKNNLNLFSCA